MNMLLGWEKLCAHSWHWPSTVEFHKILHYKIINLDYNMTKQLCMKHIHHKIRSKFPLNRVSLPT